MIVCQKSAASVGMEVDEPHRDRRRRRQDDRRHVQEPHTRFPQRQDGEAEDERGHEVGEAAGVMG